MRGVSFLFIAALAGWASAADSGNTTGFSTGGSGMSSGQHDSSHPGETKLLLSEEQRHQIQKGRSLPGLDPKAKKALDDILKTPNTSAFEREEIIGQVNYQQPSGWDGRKASNPQGKKADVRLEGGGRSTEMGNESLRQRHENSHAMKNLNQPMSALEAGSRRTYARPKPGSMDSGERFRSLRDDAPRLIPQERAMAYRDSERRARRRLLNGGSNAAYSDLSLSQIGQGKFDEARETADRAIQSNPNDADAYALRAIASEALGDEKAKIAALENAARLNPKRFKSLLREARSGAKLFDPSASDSWNLLTALSNEDADSSAVSGKHAALAVLALLVLGIPTFAGMTLYRKLSPHQQRRAASWWRTAYNGQVLPSLQAGPADPVRRPEGDSIVRLEPGLRIADKYKLIRRLGIDGTVEIWKALDMMLDRPVLLKRLYERRSDSGEWEIRLSDAKKAATLHHPNVADLYEILDMPIGLYVVYEYPSGKTLRDIIDEVGPIPLLQAIDILIPVCRALQHAHHRAIVHGGLSPERIVLTRQGYVKVTDFVLARTTASGGEAYVAPEAKRGEPTRASDIYSLGACLHELLTGAVPGLNGDAEPDARSEDLLGRALDLDGRSRMQSALLFHKELESLREVLRKETGRAPSPPRDAKPPVHTDLDQDGGSRSETAA